MPLLEGFPPFADLRPAVTRCSLRCYIQRCAAYPPPPYRALLQDFGRNGFWRAALGAMLHYIIKADLNISNHSY